jgi:hypothetical protein
MWFPDSSYYLYFQINGIVNFYKKCEERYSNKVCVPDPGKGVCADPVNGGAILGKGGPDPQGGNKERQSSPDKGREKT